MLSSNRSSRTTALQLYLPNVRVVGRIQKYKNRRLDKARTVKRRRRWFAHPYLIVPVSLFAVAALAFLPAFVYSFPNGDDAAQHYWWSS